MWHRFLALFLSACLMASCAGHIAHPVKTVQAGDGTKDCASLENESQNLDLKAKNLIAQFYKKGQSNTGAEVIGVFFPPALLALDLGSAEKTEFRALVRRKEQLRQLAGAQGCPEIKVKTLDDYKREMVHGS